MAIGGFMLGFGYLLPGIFVLIARYDYLEWRRATRPRRRPRARQADQWDDY